MIAPVIGDWIIESFSWRWVFIIQAALAMVAAIGVFKMKESLQEVNRERLVLVFHGYLRLTRNRQFFFSPWFLPVSVSHSSPL